jgi:glycosyltransferase involved in cell wall biosynthesis
MGRFLCKIVDAIISQNPEDAIFLKEKLKIPHTKVHIIPNGVDTEFFDPRKVTEEEKRDFIKKMNLGSKKILVFVGRLEARKRIELLLLALRLIVKERKDVVLLIIGPDHGMKSKLIESSRKLNLENHVRFCGKLSDHELRTAYAVSDISVSLSAQEAFGLALAESMAMEKPVVAHAWKGIKYVVKNGVGGLLVNPFDYKNLAKKCLHLLEDDSFRINLGKKAREYVINNFSLDVMTNHILKVYTHVLRS